MDDFKYHRVEGNSNTFQYFAYGSNMLKERIHLNNPTATVCGIGKLYGFRLTFEVPYDHQANNWHGASATIRPSEPRDYVYGIVWSLNIEDLAHLDSQELSYSPIHVDVVLEDGRIMLCRSYEMFKETTTDMLPSPHYKRVIIAGAKQHDLPEDYIQFLERLPDNGLAVVPPNYERVIDLIAKSILGKEKNGQITPLDYKIERELMALVKA